MFFAQDQLHLHKLIKVGKFALKSYKIAAKPKAAGTKAIADAPAVPDALAGMKVRVVTEEHPQISGSTCTVVRSLDGDQLLLESEDYKGTHWKVPAQEVDWLKLVLPRSKPRPLQLNLVEKNELAYKFKDLIIDAKDEFIQDSQLSGSHIQLQNWISIRDIG